MLLRAASGVPHGRWPFVSQVMGFDPASLRTVAFVTSKRCLASADVSEDRTRTMPAFFAGSPAPQPGDPHACALAGGLHDRRGRGQRGIAVIAGTV
jgi:hypothetical protein